MFYSSLTKRPVHTHFTHFLQFFSEHDSVTINTYTPRAQYINILHRVYAFMNHKKANISLYIIISNSGCISFLPESCCVNWK